MAGYLVALLVLCPRGVGVTPAHVSGRYHQLLRILFVRNSRSHRRRQTDGVFSTDTGLELLGVSEPIC